MGGAGGRGRHDAPFRCHGGGSQRLSTCRSCGDAAAASCGEDGWLVNVGTTGQPRGDWLHYGVLVGGHSAALRRRRGATRFFFFFVGIFALGASAPPPPLMVAAAMRTRARHHLRRRVPSRRHTCPHPHGASGYSRPSGVARSLTAARHPPPFASHAPVPTAAAPRGRRRGMIEDGDSTVITVRLPFRPD